MKNNDFTIYEAVLKKTKLFKKGMFANTIEQLKFLNDRLVPDADFYHEIIKVSELAAYFAIVLSDGGILDIDDESIEYIEGYKYSHTSIHTLNFTHNDIIYGTICNIPSTEKVIALRYGNKKDENINDVDINNLTEDEINFLKM